MSPSLTIAFFAESCLPIHATSLDERPLGGTETALIRVAKLLQEKGHRVTVFTSHPAPLPAFGDHPSYVPSPKIKQAAEFDVLILVKDFRPVTFALPAKRVFFWTGDGPEQFSNFGVGDQRIVSKLAGLFTVSNWHTHALCDASGFPKQLCTNVGNGVFLPYFDGSETRDMKRLMWASAPNRGLELAFAVFRTLYERDQKLSFHIFAGFDLYDTDKKFSGPLVERFNTLKKQIQAHPGCVLHGNTTQQLLAREYMKSAILFYPNIVPETCCIVAMEAQAGGCPVIASNFSALPETIGDGGIVINGDIGSKRYIEECLSLVRNLLSDKKWWAVLSKNGLEKAARIFAWNAVADRIEETLLQS